MQAKKVVKEMLKSLKTRTEIFELGEDRGQGIGIHIEKWILIEMLAKLIKMREPEKFVVEGEHKYKDKKSSRYEHCDLWWKENSKEHWLEVKTIIVGEPQRKGKYDEIVKDLNKLKNIKNEGEFHHLAFLFPVKFDSIDEEKKDLENFYDIEGFESEKAWSEKMGEDKYIIIALYKKRIKD